MQYEGEHKQVALRGIERALANGVAQDGGMEQVINLIPRNGSYVPYSPYNAATQRYSEFMKRVDGSGRTITPRMVRVHHTSTGDNTIIVYDDEYWINPEIQHVDQINSDVIVGRHAGHVNDIVFIGNRMDLSLTTGIEHWLWKNGQYVNQNDLNIRSGQASDLPYVNFMVERGIYDGKTVYPSAQYIKLHRHYTEADVDDQATEDAFKYVKNSGSMGSDAVALLDSIRYMGGITGYALVAAAWRLKGSYASSPQYVMASSVLLMGAPEIYLKDGLYEDLSTHEYSIQKPSTSHFVDMFAGTVGYSQPILNWKELWDLESTDDRSSSDMQAGEYVVIEPLTENATCLIHRVDSLEGNLHYYPEIAIQTPSLYGEKYVVYHDGSMNDSGKEHRGIRITRGTGNVLKFKISAEVAEKYKDEIDCLCIFMSPVISPYKHKDALGVRMKSDFCDDGGVSMRYHSRFVGVDGDSYLCGGSFSPEMKSTSEIKEEISNITGLYKVREIHLNDLSQDWTKVNLSGGILNTDRMLQHTDTMLKVTDMMPIGFTTGNIFGYNERLHVYNFTKNEVYRLPYQALEYYPGGGQYQTSNLSGVTYKYQIEVVDSNGSRIVEDFESECSALNPLICCADKDAKSMRIVQRHENNGYYLKVFEYDKTTQGVGGLTRGIITDGLFPFSPVTNDTDRVSEETYTTTDEDEANAGALIHVDKIKPDSRSRGKNEIRVSYTDLTLFEVNNSYKIGHGEIIGLARLSISLSQDNFSKFPLLIFCTDGVYTLGVDATGKFAYTTQTPVSPVVCTNKNGICEIGGAVLFPSEYGLQRATENGVDAVAIQACGEPKNNPTINAAQYRGLDIYRNAMSHANLVQLLDVADIEQDFRKYIQLADTYLRYVHALNMVVAYNKNWGYSYLIDVNSWTVVKIAQRFCFDNGDFPKQVFSKLSTGESPSIISMRFDYESGGDNVQCVLATRPIALETRHLKSTYRVVLRGEFVSAAPDKYAGLYIFGSLDGEHWYYLDGKEKLMTENKFYDIGVETYHVSYKYLMAVFVGELQVGCHIEGLEITSDAKYSNKLK